MTWCSSSTPGNSTTATRRCSPRVDGEHIGPADGAPRALAQTDSNSGGPQRRADQQRPPPVTALPALARPSSLRRQPIMRCCCRVPPWACAPSERLRPRRPRHRDGYYEATLEIWAVSTPASATLASGAATPANWARQRPRQLVSRATPANYKARPLTHAEAVRTVGVCQTPVLTETKSTHHTLECPRPSGIAKTAGSSLKATNARTPRRKGSSTSTARPTTSAPSAGPTWAKHPDTLEAGRQRPASRTRRTWVLVDARRSKSRLPDNGEVLRPNQVAIIWPAVP